MESASDIDFGHMLTELINEVDKLPTAWKSIEDVKYTVDSFIQGSFSHFLSCHPVIQQKNTVFKKTLFTSLQNIIMTALHDKIFYFIVEKNQLDDNLIYNKCRDLSALRITPDQLGALEDYCIPLPATVSMGGIIAERATRNIFYITNTQKILKNKLTENQKGQLNIENICIQVVELASLDMHKSAADKLMCLSTAFDLAMAELKGAMVDVIALSCDSTIPVLNVSDITPILATILIHAKPMHFISNLFYIENFYFLELTNTESECLLAFKTAVDKVKVVTTDLLLPRSARIYCDIGLEDIFKLTSDKDDKYDHKGQRICTPNNPLERHIEQFTSMITASTFNNVQI